MRDRLSRAESWWSSGGRLSRTGWGRAVGVAVGAACPRLQQLKDPESLDTVSSLGRLLRTFSLASHCAFSFLYDKSRRSQSGASQGRSGLLNWNWHPCYSFCVHHRDFSSAPTGQPTHVRSFDLTVEWLLLSFKGLWSTCLS